MRGLRLHVDLRLLLGAAAALVAAVTVLVLTRPPDTVEVVVAAEPLPPGVPLSALALEVRPVHQQSGALLAGRLDEVSAWVLVAPLSAGDPLLESLLAPPPARRHDVIGLSLPAERALHGELVAGDRVDVYGVEEEATVRLAASIPVLAAFISGGGLGGSDVAVLLAVDEAVAAALVEAAFTSDLYLVGSGR